MLRHCVAAALHQATLLLPPSPYDSHSASVSLHVLSLAVLFAASIQLCLRQRCLNFRRLCLLFSGLLMQQPFFFFILVLFSFTNKLFDALVGFTKFNQRCFDLKINKKRCIPTSVPIWTKSFPHLAVVSSAPGQECALIRKGSRR